MRVAPCRVLAPYFLRCRLTAEPTLNTCPVLQRLNLTGGTFGVSGEEPELPEPVKDLVRYRHDDDAVAAPRLAISNALAAERRADSRCPDQVSITAPVNNLPRAPAALLARREERTGPPRSGPVRGRERSRHAGSARAGRYGEIRAGAAGQLWEFGVPVGSADWPPPSALRRRVQIQPPPSARGFPGNAVTAGQRQPGALPGPARPKARIPQSKGAQNAQIGAIWTLIDI
jgi:hypothetical protein